jgi:hypothetical protein
MRKTIIAIKITLNENKQQNGGIRNFNEKIIKRYIMENYTMWDKSFKENNPIICIKSYGIIANKNS